MKSYLRQLEHSQSWLYSNAGFAPFQWTPAVPVAAVFYHCAGLQSISVETTDAFILYKFSKTFPAGSLHGSTYSLLCFLNVIYMAATSWRIICSSWLPSVFLSRSCAKLQSLHQLTGKKTPEYQREKWAEYSINVGAGLSASMLPWTQLTYFFRTCPDIYITFL